MANHIIDIITTADSSMLDLLVYYPESEILTTIFTSKDMYCYLGVPKEVWEELSSEEESHGKAFNRLIVDRYQFTRVKED